MDYKLAKKLKDAGFPIRIARCNDCYINDRQGCKECEGLNPELSELISEIGEKFYNLRFCKGQFWRAESITYDPTTEEPFAEGETPEEAVAKLFIKLNK